MLNYYYILNVETSFRSAITARGIQVTRHHWNWLFWPNLLPSKGSNICKLLLHTYPILHPNDIENLNLNSILYSILYPDDVENLNVN